jgi:DNA (cytosine-5)-methyltransferase 1
VPHPVGLANSDYTAVSLFSGCGGFCEGVRLAGFDVAAAVEWDKFAAETYRHNFPDVPLFEGDIAKFRKPGARAWEVEHKRFMALEEGGPIDLVFGGPPCQGYSQIGPRDLEDPRNALYGQFTRLLRDLKPRAFLMENVPNMLMLERGLFAKRALTALRRSGYSNAQVSVLHATNFGVPQLRKRALFFGTRDDLDFPFDAGDWIDAVAKCETRSPGTVWEAIGDLPENVSKSDGPLPYPRSTSTSRIRSELRLDVDGEHYAASAKLAQAGELLLFNHHTKEIQERRLALIAQLLPGLKGDSLPKEVWNGLRPEKWRRLHPDKPAYTILAQMHRDLSEWVHPKYDRWITVREAARLQSFHDGFVFKSSEWQMLKQIGNAVPPLLGHAAATVALRALQFIDGECDPPGELQGVLTGKCAMA